MGEDGQMKSAELKVVVALSIFLNACSSGSSVLKSYKVVLPGNHSGEYLQAETSNTVITVNRGDSEIKGLVRVHLDSDLVEAINADAKEAREIKLSAGQIAFRLDKNIRLVSGGRTETVVETAQALRHFKWSTETHSGRLYFDDVSGTSFVMTVNDRFQVESKVALPGSVRAVTGDATGADHILYQTPAGLWWGRVTGDTRSLENIEPILPNVQSDYAFAAFYSEGLFIAYLDKNEGVLHLFKRSTDGETSQTVIDGTPLKTYRGMDITAFDDGGHPGWLYLDAWALKLRMARLQDGEWKSQEIPVKGAVGFYTQVLEKKDKALKVAFHNFRTEHDDHSQTFENLAVAEINLK